VPQDAVGGVMADISGRRGRILGMESAGRFELVIAHVPQAELHHYSSTLRAITSGRGRHREAFDHFEEVPRELVDGILAKHTRNHANGD
jgi:elongation factor G